MSLFAIKVTPETSPIIQKLLFRKGFKWSGRYDSVQNTEKPYLFPWSDKTICHSESPRSNDLVIDMDQFLHWFETDELPKPKLMLGEYLAEFSVNSFGDPIIKVGCQNITLEQVRTVAKAFEYFADNN